MAVLLSKKKTVLVLERDFAQGLFRGALKLPLTVVRVQTQLGGRFSENYHVYPLSTSGDCFDVVSLDKALYPHKFLFDWGVSEFLVRQGWQMCTISSMRQNGRTACSPWRRNGTRMGMGGDKTSDLISDYKLAHIPLNESCSSSICFLSTNE